MKYEWDDCGQSRIVRVDKEKSAQSNGIMDMAFGFSGLDLWVNISGPTHCVYVPTT